AAIPHVDAHGAVSRGAHGARERAHAPADVSARGGAPEGRGIPHRSARLEFLARTQVRTRAGLRCLRRRGRAPGAERARDHGRGAGAVVTGAGTAAVHVGALLRAAFSVLTAGAVRDEIRREAVSR